ncbi:hypothetical protein D9758_005034 [Tetrapyrgos nigripes]|uniref:Uncharacterized protein n=1 Tax=Tetrapyrgos nigripes TaxID=182062 RepID=A0A8H5GVP9_9AGAR|nr:hypothetical protein D9758_005034 [Tetrapyrgos nigripes]
MEQTCSFHLPSYPNTTSTPTTPPPDYHSHPEGGEQCLGAATFPRARPTGTYVKKSKSMTIILTSQNPQASMPSYSRNGSVNGFILIENRTSVTEVQVELVGEMSVVIDRDRTTPLVQDHQTLWKYDSTSSDPESSSSSTPCPSAIPFACVFPPTFVSPAIVPVNTEPCSFPLPPSVNFRYPGEFVAAIEYHIKATVIYGRSPSLCFWNKMKTLTIPLSYLPRDRPLYAVSSGISFFSSLKIAPEEWHQTVSAIKPRLEGTVPPIDCSLFVPSLKVYGLSDIIPVHVNLTGPIQSLRELMPLQQHDKMNRQPSLIHIHIVRQVYVSLKNGRHAVRSSVIGEGKVHELPPHIDDTGWTNEVEEGIGTLHWESTIQCSSTVTLGSFRTDGISLKDFIILQVCPVKKSSHFPCHRVEVNIKLVTDAAGFDV